METFKIENFCYEHNKEFKLYYEYLTNPLYENMILLFLKYIHHDRIKNKIYTMIIKNHNYILDKLNKIDIIISFYQKNNLINRSEIGLFFQYYLENRKDTNVNNNDHLFKLFYKLITYENCISVLRECFYIFSNYRACIYFMTPSINFYKTNKETISKVIFSFKDNLNTLNQIISKIYLGQVNPWGSIYYSSAYAMFETLFIINKYYKDPLKELDIKFIIKKKNKIKNNINEIIIDLRKSGYDLWYVIPFIFEMIFKKYSISGLPESITFGYKKIYYQKMNNLIGLMAFILVKEGYISNINIFKKFND